MIDISFNEILKVIKIIKKAQDEVLKIYQSDFKCSFKDDNSPLTEADTNSNNIICSELLKYYPSIPILSEESSNKINIKNKNDYFWCIDPLDGTKEFLKKNDEFTINISLIKNQYPILGVICVPVLRTIYAAGRGIGSFKFTSDGSLIPIKIKKRDPSNLVFAVSRSHLDKFTKKFIGDSECIRTGSSLKFTMVAEGKVDCYPRFGKTMLWDVAAGHCIIREAGGQVLDTKGRELIYDISKLSNVEFVASNIGITENINHD